MIYRDDPHFVAPTIDQRIPMMAREPGEEGPDDDAETPKPKKFMTYGEILSWAKENPREFVVPDLLWLRSLVLIVGEAKEAGKSTFAWGLAAACLYGREFLGHAMPKLKTVFVSEEGNLEIADKVTTFRLDPSEGSVMPRSMATPQGMEAACRDAEEEAQRIGAKIIAIDTFSFWARLEGSSENDAGVVAEALRPAQDLANKGYLVLLTHHPAKGEGKGARGSGNFNGLPEVIFTISMIERGSNKRKVSVKGRIGHRDFVMEYNDGKELGVAPSYVMVGNVASASQEAKEGEVFRQFEARKRWLSVAEMERVVPARSGVVGNAVRGLLRRGLVQRIGNGRPGSPYRYGVQTLTDDTELYGLGEDASGPE